MPNRKPDNRPRCAVCERAMRPDPLSVLLGLPTEGMACSDRCESLIPDLATMLVMQEAFACALAHGWMH